MRPPRIQRLIEMHKNSPKDEFLNYAIAKEYESLGDLDMALETFINLKELNENYIGLYYHLGKLYERLDDTSNALKTYDDGINISKKISDFHSLSELNNAKINLEIEDD